MRLRHVNDTMPGIARPRRANGFIYRHPDGPGENEIRNEERIRKLAIPPAYELVWICALPNGHPRAVGRDARGRKRSRCRASWRSTRDEAKFDRLVACGESHSSLRRRVANDLALPGSPGAAAPAGQDRRLDRVKNRSSTLEGQTQLASEQATIAELTARLRGLKRRASRSLKTWFLAAAGVATIMLPGTAAWVASAPRPVFPAVVHALDEAGDAGRGKRVFDAADCASCHASPGQPDNLRLGGGMALASPFGTLYPPNISPDPVDGIGRWTNRDLANALLSGVAPSGTHYYPAFPYTSFTHMRLEDVRDLAAYLRTLPPVTGRTPPHDLPFPFSVRRAVGLWKWLYFAPGQISPDPSRGAAWNRGRYLAEAVSHCAECHSPRDMLGGIRSASRSSTRLGATGLDAAGGIAHEHQSRVDHHVALRMPGMRHDRCRTRSGRHAHPAL